MLKDSHCQFWGWSAPTLPPKESSCRFLLWDSSFQHITGEQSCLSDSACTVCTFSSLSCLFDCDLTNQSVVLILLKNPVCGGQWITVQCIFFMETYSTTELCLGTTYVYYNTLKMVNARLYGRSTSLGGKFWKYSYIYLYVFTFVKSSCRQQSLSWLRFLDLRPTHELVVSQRKVVPLPLSATLPRWANPIALYV